jgi:hypothetical protein
MTKSPNTPQSSPQERVLPLSVADMCGMTAQQHRDRAAKLRALGGRKAKNLAIQHELMATLTEAKAVKPERLTPSEIDSLRADLRRTLAEAGAALEKARAEKAARDRRAAAVQEIIARALDVGTRQPRTGDEDFC